MRFKIDVNNIGFSTQPDSNIGNSYNKILFIVISQKFNKLVGVVVFLNSYSEMSVETNGVENKANVAIHNENHIKYGIISHTNTMTMVNMYVL